MNYDISSTPLHITIYFTTKHLVILIAYVRAARLLSVREGASALCDNDPRNSINFFVFILRISNDITFLTQVLPFNDEGFEHARFFSLMSTR